MVSALLDTMQDFRGIYQSGDEVDFRNKEGNRVLYGLEKLVKEGVHPPKTLDFSERMKAFNGTDVDISVICFGWDFLRIYAGRGYSSEEIYETIGDDIRESVQEINQEREKSPDKKKWDYDFEVLTLRQEYKMVLAALWSGIRKRSPVRFLRRGF